MDAEPEFDMEVDMEQLLAMHRRTFPIPTPVGTVILRALPKVTADRVDSYLRGTYGDYDEIMQSIDHLKKISDLHEKQGKKPVLNLDQARELHLLTSRVAPYMDHFSIKCFVSPELNTVEELLAFSDTLSTTLWRQISIMLLVLTNPLPIQEKHFQFLALCKDYGIPVSKDLTAEVMTVHQFYALSEASRQEAIEAKKILTESGVL